MAHYVDKVDGACIESKESTVVWDYQEADLDFGHRISLQLSKHLQQLIQKGYPIQLVVGKSYLEVKPDKLKKSMLVREILARITQK